MFVLIVCTVYGLTHFAHLYICALCKTGAKQPVSYTTCTTTLRVVHCVKGCMSGIGKS
jgi:hypothetical protein